MDRSSQVTTVASECDTTRLFAEYERLRKRMHMLWAVPVRDMSAIFEVMTQLDDTRTAYKAACDREQAVAMMADKSTIR
jgi:hypothetical protein